MSRLEQGRPLAFLFLLFFLLQTREQRRTSPLLRGGSKAIREGRDTGARWHRGTGGFSSGDPGPGAEVQFMWIIHCLLSGDGAQVAWWGKATGCTGWARAEQDPSTAATNDKLGVLRGTEKKDGVAMEGEWDGPAGFREMVPGSGSPSLGLAWRVGWGSTVMASADGERVSHIVGPITTHRAGALW